MQNRVLALEEVIWEITSKCNNGCSYCGSAAYLNQAEDDTWKRIIENIIAMKTIKEVNISGGDPLLVDMDTHYTITAMLKQEGIKAKIIINPISLQTTQNVDAEEILRMYDWIGVSVNNIREYNNYKVYLKDFENVTLITNINVSNYHMLDAIAAELPKDRIWTIQFTIADNNNAIYRDESLAALVRVKLHAAITNGLKIVFGDNCNKALCGAGSRSVGITFDGVVLPCLSMRSWWTEDEIHLWSMDESHSLNHRALSSIWRDSFDGYRFEEFKCCKDACDNRILEVQPAFIKRDIGERTGPYAPVDWPEPNWPPRNNQVMMYGVTTGPVMVYGVKDSWSSGVSYTGATGEPPQ